MIEACQSCCAGYAEFTGCSGQKGTYSSENSLSVRLNQPGISKLPRLNVRFVANSAGFTRWEINFHFPQEQADFKAAANVVKRPSE